MKRFLFLSIGSMLGTVLLAGCSNNEKFGNLLITTDLTPSYTVALETSKDVVGFYELTRSPVGADKTLRFDRLTPGEYRLEVFNAANTSVFLTNSFGVSTTGGGDTDYTLTTGLPAQ